MARKTYTRRLKEYKLTSLSDGMGRGILSIKSNNRKEKNYISLSYSKTRDLGMRKSRGVGMRKGEKVGR